MSNHKTISSKLLAVGIAGGLLVDLAYFFLIPKPTRIADSEAMIAWAVPFLLFLGAYVILRERDHDLYDDKTTFPETAEARLRLVKRFRLQRIAGWIFAVAGVIRAAMILAHY